ncbi:MAG: SurA N-terminal domain-containing protein [Bacteroidota bacterium]|nr:SurA N-terminal domain-containing protein [Bacteroidota bacterium]
MATLQKLRNRMGIVVALVIGMALIAFILGDFLKSGSQMMNSKRFEIGEINGKSINYQDFQARVENSVENYKRNSGNQSPDDGALISIRNQVWTSYLNELVMEDQFSSLGIECSADELFNMVQGNNIHPQISSLEIFKNEVTGEFDRAKVIQFMKNMDNDPRAYAAWLEFEKSMMNDRVYTKYQNLIIKGLYVTRDMVERDHLDSNRKYNASYVSQRFTMVPDSVITITEEDVKDYYDKNKADFTQEASVDLAYVAFDIIPSEKDRQVVQTWINEEMVELSRIENTKQYINLNGDTGFNAEYIFPSELEENLQTWAEDAETDSVYGPYFVDDVWKLAKVTDVKMIPDSVRASHILIRPDQNNRIEAAQVTADSLIDLINNGADFAKLAAEFGTDGTVEKGGDLDWFKKGQMVEEFYNASFYGEKGDLVTVTTQFGVHVLKVTDQGPKSRKLQVGILDRRITFGQETYQKAYSTASRFAATYNTGEKFEDGVLEDNLTKRIASSLRHEDRIIAGLESPRSLIMWAFEANKGDLSEIYEFGNRFVIAKITEKREDGIAPLDQVYGEVESIVRNLNKGEYLVQEFQKAGSTSLEDLATKLNTDVRTITDASFNSFSIPGIGVEPGISAAFPFMVVNQISDPIKGNNGVYVLKLTEIIEPATQLDYVAGKTRLTQAMTSRAGYQAFQALEKSSKIIDRRNNFY